MKKIGISIVGGAGYGAGELLRLLSFHPEVEVVSVISSSSAGQSISSIHPQLRGLYDFNFEKKIEISKLIKFEKAFIVTSLPHGVSAKFIYDIASDLKKNNINLIDMSGDFRLKDPALREAYYSNDERIDTLARGFVFGLPELNRAKIRSAQFISNPGCFALTSILALAPLAALKLNAKIAIDGKSGTSGAGRTTGEPFHHPIANSNAFAYKALTHRHEPEIAQALSEIGGSRFSISFVPHVIPCSRGIYITAHVFLDTPVHLETMLEQYQKFYKDSPFVRIREKAPELHWVVGSNYCDINLCARGNILVVTAATDNLIKGMCGTAIQNINLISGCPEELGLKIPGMGPV